MNMVKVLKIDVLSIQPYLTLKNLLLLLGLVIAQIFLSKSPLTPVVIVQMFALLFSSYPFMVGEGAGIDSLYKIFGIRSDHVVKGRYLYSILAVIITAGIGLLSAWVASFLFPINQFWTAVGALSLPTLFSISLINFLVYPFYFKLGYLKAKPFTLIPFILLGILFMFTDYLTPYIQSAFRWITIHPILFGLGLLLVWLFALGLSLAIATHYYRSRDF